MFYTVLVLLKLTCFLLHMQCQSMTSCSVNFSSDHIENEIKEREDKIKSEVEQDIPLIKAIKNEDVEQIQKLINSKADVNALNKKKQTPLIIAAQSTRKIKIFDLLLQNGANPNLEDEDHFTAIGMVDKYAYNLHLRREWIVDEPVLLTLDQKFRIHTMISKLIIRKLLLYGADPEIIYHKRFENSSYFDPRFFTFVYYKINLDEVFTEHGKLVISEVIKTTGLPKDLSKILNEYIAYSSTVMNMKIKNSMSIHNALSVEHDNKLKKLLYSAGTYYDTLDTPEDALKAIKIMDDYICQMLDSVGKCNFYINFANHCNYTFLVKSVRLGCINTAKKLIDMKADINLFPKDILYNAMDGLAGNTSGLRYDLVKFLLEQKADINYIDYQGKTFLIHAIEISDYNLILLALNHKANIDIQYNIKCLSHNNCNYELTPLIEACSKNDIEIVKLLLDYKADANFKNRTGDTPLSKAFEKANIRLLDLLLDHAADETIKTFDGRSIEDVLKTDQYDQVFDFYFPNYSDKNKVSLLKKCLKSIKKIFELTFDEEEEKKEHEEKTQCSIPWDPISEISKYGYKHTV